MTDGRVEAESCGLGAALRIITGKWKPTIIWLLHVRPRRFAELRRTLDGISEKVLAEQLRDLERDGVVHRHDFEEVPPHVEYSLTDAGSELNGAVHTLALWGDRHAVGRRPGTDLPGSLPGGRSLSRTVRP